jgi:catechol 2,3-dioxygenase-like lactoylglutathione lyase family enzyme
MDVPGERSEDAMTGATTSFNWIGLAVSDLARSRRFYEELLGFTYERQLVPPDEATAQLCQVDPPANLTAVYLRLDGFVLELLHFDRETNPPARRHPMNEPGLTHISVSVADLRQVVARVHDYGGDVLANTDLGTAVCIRDPDGQLIELLVSERRAGDGTPSTQ